MEKHPDEVKDPAEKDRRSSQSEFDSFDFFSVVFCFQENQDYSEIYEVSFNETNKHGKNDVNNGQSVQCIPPWSLGIPNKLS